MSVPPPPPSLDQIVKNQKVFFKAQYSLKIQEPPPISGNHTKSSNDTFVKTDGKDALSKRIQIATHFHTGLNCGKGCMIFLDHENELTHANTLLQFGGTPNENRSLTFGCDDIWYLILTSHYNTTTCHEWQKLQIPSHSHNSQNKAEASEESSLAYSKRLQRIFVMTYFSRIHSLCLKTLTWDVLHLSLPCSYNNCLYNYMDQYLLVSYCIGYGETQFVQVHMDEIEKVLNMPKNNSTTPLNLDFKELNVLVCREIARGKFLAVPNSMSDHHSHLSTTQQDQDYNIYVCGGIDRNASIASEIESLYRVNAINNSDITKEIYLDPELYSDSRMHHFMSIIPQHSTQLFASNKDEEFSHGHHHTLLITFFHKPSKSILFYEYDITANFDDIEFGNSITFGSHLYNYKYGTLKRLVHNNIPIHLLVSNAVLGNSVRPFLHCYVNEKDGRKMGVFVANNRLLYLLNLDYMNPRFCFRFTDTTIMKDQLRTLCDITIRTGAASLEHYVVDKQLGMLPQQVHAQPGNAQHGTNGK